MLLRNETSVLLVDNLSSNITCLRVLLRFFGIQYINEVKSINMAMNLVRDKKYDFVFISSKLFLNAKNLKINKKKIDKKTKILAFNDGGQVNIPDFEKYGVDDVLMHPFNQKDLYQSLEQYFV